MLDHMRLMIVNYSMDEDSNVLAWQASVVRELAKHCEKVVVLTEQIGRFTPPENVTIHLIPRRPWGIPKILGSRLLMNFTVSRLVREHQIDACFIHMAMEWTYRLFPTLKLHRIPILLWYAHGTVTNRLRLAHACANKVITSTPEGFRLPSKKKIVIGQGINTDLFNIPVHATERNDILYVGRISPRKRVNLLVKAMASLKEITPELPIRLKVIGPTLSEVDRTYLDEIRTDIRRSNLTDVVEILGDMPQQEIVAHYKSAFLHLNVSQTGSMDKTVMEALACGCPVLTSNEAFFALLANYPEFILRTNEPGAIAERILMLYRRKYDPSAMRAIVVGSHDVKNFTQKVYNILLMETAK